MVKFFLFFFSCLTVLVLAGAGCIQFGGGSAASAGPMGVFRSVDKGDNWQQANVYPTAQGVKSLAGVRVYRLFTDPSDQNAFYMATRNQGLFYTYDGAKTWQSAAALAGRFVYSIAVDPKNKCVIYVTDGPHIFKTEDCSRTWHLVYTEERPSERFVSLAVDFGNSAIIYGALLGGDILVSNDSGGSWQVKRRFGTNIQDMVADPLTAQRIYVATRQNGLSRSDDGGATWVDLNQGLSGFSESYNFYRLILHPTERNIIYWISKYGILRSTDTGVTWSDLKLITPPGSVGIFSFAVNPKNEKELYYVGTVLGEKGIPIRTTFYRSVDGGATWVTKKMPTNTIPISLNVLSDGSLLMAFTLLEQ